MNTAKNGLGASTQGSTTSALAFGGSVPPGTALTESWDGTSWTEVADLATARYDIGGSGTGNTSALAFAGGTPPRTAATEEWSFPSAPAVQEGQMWIKTATGTSSVMKGHQAAGTGAWASGGSLNTARKGVGGGAVGTQTASITAGGNISGATAVSEQYNGTSWTEIAEMNSKINRGGGMRTTTDGLVASGLSPSTPGNVTFCEAWNGSSWTEVADLNTARDGVSGAGTQTNGLAFGRDDASGNTAATEECDDPKLTLKTVDTD